MDIPRNRQNPQGRDDDPDAAGRKALRRALLDQLDALVDAFAADMPARRGSSPRRGPEANRGPADND